MKFGQAIVLTIGLICFTTISFLAWFHNCLQEWMIAGAVICGGLLVFGDRTKKFP